VRPGLGDHAVTTWRVSETEQLQRILDGLATSDSADFRGGVRLWLQKGVWDTDITINHPWIELCGDGEGTEVLGKVTTFAQRTSIHDMAIRGAGRPYALRLKRNPALGFANMPRNLISNLVIGATFQGAGDGPENGVEIDGTWLTTFRHVTSAFCLGHGWLVDSTDSLYPNTTLGFECCSAVANAKNGWYVRQSLTCGHWIRGSVEQNGYADPALYHEMQLESVIDCTIEQVDFESSVAFTTSAFALSTCNIGEIKNCNFVQSLSGGVPLGIPRWLEGASCNGWHAHNIRVENYPGGRNAQFDERGSGNRIEDIYYVDQPGPPTDNRSVHHSKVFSAGHPTRMGH